MNRLGYPEIILRSDNEPAMKAFRDAVAKELKEKFGIRAIPQGPPKYDSASSGFIESGIKAIKEKVRTLVIAARELHGVVMGPDHAALAWCIRFAGQVLSRTVKGADGLTAFQRAYQRKTHPRALPAAWGEKVLYMTASKKKVQLEDKFSDGILVGLKEGTEELIVGTPAGCYVCRSVKRRSREDATDPVFFNSIRGTIRNMVPNGEPKEPREPKEVKSSFDVQPVSVSLPPRIVPDHSAPRRVYIRNSVELAKYGYSGACPGCEAAQSGLGKAGHNEECRTRIVAAMSQDPGLSERVREAHARVGQEEPESKKAKVAMDQPSSSSPQPVVGDAAVRCSLPPELPSDTVVSGAGAAVSSSSSPPPPLASPSTSSPPAVPAPQDMEVNVNGRKRQAEPIDDSIRGDRPAGDDDQMVEEICVMERFEQEREICAERARDSQAQCLEALGFSSAERQSVAKDLAKLGQELNDIHVAEIFSPPRVTAAAGRMGLTPGLAFDISQGWDLDNPANIRRLWQYVRSERPMLIIGSSECRAFSSLQNLSQGSPNYQATLDKGARHLKLVTAIYKWQASQGRWFVHESPI